MSLLRSSVPALAAVMLSGGAFSPFSPQDIVTHARLQTAMRFCQQQDRANRDRPIADDRQAREAMLECLRANRINIR